MTRSRMPRERAAGPGAAEGWDAARFGPPHKVKAATGRTLFEDVTTYEGVDGVAVEDGTLRLAFRRGVQGACSIPKHGAACRARIVREAKIPEPVATLSTLAKACAASYRADKAPRDADSIVFFPVRLAWTGSLAVEAKGPVQCRPTP